MEIRTIARHACCAWTGAGSTPQRFETCELKGVGRNDVDAGPNATRTIELNRISDSQAPTPCHAESADSAYGASGDSRYRSRTHVTEGPIAGIPENQSGNDLDRFCSLTEDRVILGDRFNPHFSQAVNVLTVFGDRSR